MRKFTILTGIAAPLDMANVDTDQIIPKQFLKTISRTGLAHGLFHDLRHDENGVERSEFMLNTPAYKQAKILIAGDNFGCGSSREHAPWALLDYGFSCIIAPSFADIFYDNCFKNGILPVVLARAEVDVLLRDASYGANATMTIDLPAQRIHRFDGTAIAFDIEPHRKRRLLEGLDDIALTLKKSDAIRHYESRIGQDHPWV